MHTALLNTRIGRSDRGLFHLRFAARSPVGLDVAISVPVVIAHDDGVNEGAQELHLFPLTFRELTLLEGLEVLVTVGGGLVYGPTEVGHLIVGVVYFGILVVVAIIIIGIVVICICTKVFPIIILRTCRQKGRSFDRCGLD